MELLLGIALIIVLKSFFKKIIKRTFLLLSIPISIFAASSIFEISIATMMLIALLVVKVLKEIIKKCKIFKENIFTSYEEYENGFMKKLVCILFDLNIIVFWLIVGIISVLQITNPFMNLLDVEVLLIAFVSTWIIKFIETLLYFQLEID